MSFDLKNLLRENIRNLEPYRSARLEYQSDRAIFLDANENPFHEPLNRYPDPLQRELKKQLALYKGIRPEMIFLGNGSDEAIDLLIRATCDPGKHNLVGIDPSYGMYKVAADINGVEYRKAPLREDFSLDAPAVLRTADENTRLVFLCSPNNPSANLLDKKSMFELLKKFPGLVVVDEAYIDFALEGSILPFLFEYPNLVVLQTFSKAWASAGIRLGMALASEKIIHVLNRIKYPYNVNVLTINAAMEIIGMDKERREWTGILLEERKRLETYLASCQQVEKVYPSDANFLLARFRNHTKMKAWLLDRGLVVRDRSRETHCAGCLRITVGNPEENNLLIRAIENYEE